jgi:signal transduction histidine kinase
MNIDEEKGFELEDEHDIDFVEDEIEQLLSGMPDGANRTVEIIRGLILFSRVDEDDLKAVDLEEGLNSTVVLLNSTLKHKLTVVRNFEGIPPVECYGGKMNQVFMNIISNAAQAILQANPNSTDGVIEITTKTIDENVEIRFKDNGPGMSDEVKERIFEPFFTTKPVGEGTGLGMSIVFKIIERLNGEIVLNSEPGKGTEFIITIPVLNKKKELTHA